MNNVVEVSPCLLFEASGDSENHHQERGLEGDDVLKGHEDHSDDDAESCRCGSQMTSRSTDHDPVEEEEEEEEEEEAEVAGENEDHDDGDGEVNSYGRSPEKRDRENRTVDLSSTGNDERSISEIEKNRMFWEACLAS
ncbi:hypothetical protein CARUB_v10018216mg [Capsella rubella]|uniref:Uncharacterized protein n=1 Tax=Capsella rubella TaxID=81985 RepID=R0HI85_9BRAS|nr:uncharacterized protein LOC17887431 [Capsella rubella]EOA24925.1 hypothetical protein CARUB_v10018216mg [Capsella rubella]